MQRTHLPSSISGRSGIARLATIMAASAIATSCSAYRPAARPSVVVPPGRVRPSPESDSSADPDVVQAVFDAHNAERSRRRLPALSLNSELSVAAQGHADDMARRGKMAHRGGDGSSPFDRIKRVGYSFQIAGENVAYGFDRVESVMTGWMKSPGHRRNILGDYSEIGVGRAIAQAGASYWCVTFGTPSGRQFP